MGTMIPIDHSVGVKPVVSMRLKNFTRRVTIPVGLFFKNSLSITSIPLDLPFLSFDICFLTSCSVNRSFRGVLSYSGSLLSWSL